MQDSTGYPVAGASAKLELNQDVSDGSINYTDFENTFNSSGHVSGSVDLGIGVICVEYVVLGHLYDQNLVSSNPS